MRMSAYTLLAFSLFLLFWFTPLRITAQQAQPETLVIEGGTLIDGNGGAPVRDALIIIRGNRIETVSRKGQVSYPTGARVLQADGKFIVPGLQDSHCHYQWWMGELMLNHGVMRVALTGAGDLGLALREAIDRGKVLGPRLFLQAGTIRSAVSPRLTPVGGARQYTPEQAREVVRRALEVRPANTNLMRGVSFEVYKAAVEVAHEAGYPVVAQPIGPTVYAKEAILAGVDILEHAAGVGYSIVKDPAKWKGFGEVEVHSIDPTPFADMDETKAREFIRLAVGRNVYLEPDLIVLGRGFHKNRDKYELENYHLYNDFRLAYVPEDRRMKELRAPREYDTLKILDPAAWEYRKMAYENMVRFMKMYHDAGGKILAGTDTSSWTVPGIGLHQELHILVEEVGLTPMEAILTATRNPAEAWRVLDQMGTIESGKLADLFIVDADPLQNIDNLKEVEWVIKDGKLVELGYHPWFDVPFKSSYHDASDVLEALQERMERGIRHRSGLTDEGPVWSFGAPTPGIASISPSMVTEGDATFALTLKGVNFIQKSLVYLERTPLPTQWVSPTELKATVDERLVRGVGTYEIKVKNLDFYAQQPQWGGTTSPPRRLLVNFRY
ncbi:MAG: amidohydrolase family protein [Acidobacteria bacterium]|nr:amidohydrolase family protein [Acidobacteriota bacterium]